MFKIQKVSAVDPEWFIPDPEVIFLLFPKEKVYEINDVLDNFQI